MELLNFHQISTLKAALARKELEEEHSQHSVSGSSGKYRSKGSQLSPCHSTIQGADTSGDHKICRQPIKDLGNIEVNFLHDNDCIKQVMFF